MRTCSFFMRRLSLYWRDLRPADRPPRLQHFVGEVTMQIRDWPLAERPREKLLQLGSGALSEAELLAIWLRHGTSGMNALDLARLLLVRFGSLRSVLQPGAASLRQSGVGPRAGRNCRRRSRSCAGIISNGCRPARSWAVHGPLATT
jgi:hypothetical protein